MAQKMQMSGGGMVPDMLPGNNIVIILSLGKLLGWTKSSPVFLLRAYRKLKEHLTNLICFPSPTNKQIISKQMQ